MSRHQADTIYKDSLTHMSDTFFSWMLDAYPQKELLDSHESMPFRRRGYERDGMLQTLIERAGFKALLESVQQPDGASAKDPLAKLPQEIQHFDLESFHDRPVQAELMELLLLEKDGTGFTTNVLIHGMGGTGKTVTAVAVLQEKAIRRFFSNVSSSSNGSSLCVQCIFLHLTLILSTLLHRAL